MNKNFFYILFCALFLVICLIPSIGMINQKYVTGLANEVLNERPTLFIQENDTSEKMIINKEILSQISKYVEDHFAFRNELITINSTLIVNIFNMSPEKKVILGKDDWLFYRDTLDNYLNINVLSDRRIFCIAHTFNLIEEYSTLNNVKFLFFIAPNKNSIYGQYMPDKFKPLSKISNKEKLYNALEKENVTFINLHDVFNNKENKGDVLYFYRDTHWNSKGAAIAADIILEKIKYEPQNFSDDVFLTQNTTHIGDLYKMLYPLGKKSEPVITNQRPMTFTQINDEGLNDMWIHTYSESKEDSIVMYKDSFGGGLIQYISTCFKNAYYSGEIPYSVYRIEDLKPDVLAIEIVERSLPNLQIKPPIIKAPKRELVIAKDSIFMNNQYLVSEEVNEMSDYIRITGTYDGDKIDVNSPVYINLNNTIYEALPLGLNSDFCFTAYIPKKYEDIKELKLILKKNNVLVETNAFPITKK